METLGSYGMETLGSYGMEILGSYGMETLGSYGMETLGMEINRIGVMENENYPVMGVISLEMAVSGSRGLR